MRIAFVMPRHMHFGPRGATSIDLCVRELVGASRFRDRTTIVVHTAKQPFSGFRLAALPAAAEASTRQRVRSVSKYIETSRPEIVVVEQEFRTAVKLAALFPETCVILHTHRFEKPYFSGGMLDRAKRLRKIAGYSRLAGILHVSAACNAAFQGNYPEVGIPSAVVPNGVYVDEWCPSEERTQEILCVGRACSDKGILEAAEAIGQVLPDYPAWRARFVLSEPDRYPSYHAAVLSALAPVAHRVTLETDLPFPEVRRRNEHAAIALVPSKWLEPFGRTALEAHAGGCALISSGTGGLREISGSDALYLDAVDPLSILKSLRVLIENDGLRDSIAERGKKRVAGFEIANVASRADNLYSALLQRWHDTSTARSTFEPTRVPGVAPGISDAPL
jgi:glycosyltransferase involved in cell wall biosynthesis